MPRARGDMEVGAVGPGVSVAACSQCLFTVKIYPNRIDSIPWSGPEAVERRSPKEFAAHHIAAISAAIQLADVLTLRNAASSLQFSVSHE